MVDPEIPTDVLNLGAMHRLTAATANYGSHPGPQAVLRRGLVEEVAEYAWEVGQTKEVDSYQVEGEIGDVLWYVSEISRFQASGIQGFVSEQSLDEFQEEVAIQRLTPFIDPSGNVVDAQAHPHIFLAAAAIRVVDVLNPKNDNLWLPTHHRESLEKALGDLLTITGFIASSYSLTLSGSLSHTLAKLSSRERKPHVLDEAKQNIIMNSMRERLNIHPLIGRLLLDTLSAEDKLEEK